MKKFLSRLMYFLLAGLFLWLVAVQAGCFTMRRSDSDWAENLRKKGQHLSPQFIDIPSIDGRLIHTVLVGRSDSLPLVILVHGSPGASDAFLQYLADTVLSARARLAAIDRPGFGYTSGFGKPEPSQRLQAAAVKAVADRLAPGRKVLLAGHSLGGPVIARFAMDYPELTAGLVIVAGSIDPAQERHPWWQAAVDRPPLRWLTPKPLWTSNAEIIPLEQELNEMKGMWEKITCPVRVLHAEDDALVPVANAEFARRVLRHLPDLNVQVLPKGNHFILWSREELVRQLILDLLDRWR